MAGGTDINVLNLVAQKKQASEQAVMAAAPVRGAIDERGKVSLWLISQKKWAKFWPVDATDILKSGTANLTGPEPEEEIEQPQAKGFRLPSIIATNSMNINELIEFAEINKIDISKLTDKKDILEAIQRAGNPKTGKLEDGTIADLRKLAKDRNIDLGKLTLKDDIIAKIRAESEMPPEGPGEDSGEGQGEGPGEDRE